MMICTACHESSVCHQDRSLHDQVMLDRSFGCQTHTSNNATSEPRKKSSYFPLYWLVNGDPYNGLL